MIHSINNINFKAVRLVEQSKFSESQKNVAKDIQSKLGKKGEKNDFVIEPLDKDIVELSEVYNVKEKGLGIDKYIEYNNPILIGRYDKEHPFNYDDYINVVKDVNKKTINGLLGTIVYIGAVCLMLFLSNPKPNKAINQTKDSITAVKDSVQNTSKDTVNIFIGKLIK